MTTEDFIDLLAERQLVSDRVVRQLRPKVEEPGHKITAKSILKYLVSKEMVSRQQAKELLETTLVVSDKAESSILGRGPAPKRPPAPKSKPAPESFDLVPIDEDDDAPVPLKPLPKASKEPPPVPATATTPAKPKEKDKKEKSRPVEDDLFAIDGADDLGPQLGAVSDDFASSADAADDLGADAATAGAPRLAGLKTGKGKKKSKSSKRPAKDRSRSQWDSPLLLLGGGGLVVLLVTAVILYYLLFRESADSLLKQADNFFASQAYPQAIERYQTFLDKYSGHKDYSHAKVRLGMTQLWQAVDSPGDPGGALKTAQDVIGQIEDEPAFISDGAGQEEGLSEAKRELSGLLTRIAKSLADEADKSTDDKAAERIKQLETAIQLCNNNKYVPERFRNAPELATARETLERVQARQQRDARLAETLTQMDQAIAKGNTADAYTARTKLLSEFPMLKDDEGLAKKIREISTAAQASVKFVKQAKPAVTTEPPSAVVAEVALAERRGDAVAAAPGSVVVCVDGALYGLNAADGALLWRHFVGLAPKDTPLVLADGNVIAADVRSRGLVCLDGKTGAYKWQLPLDDELATPVLVGPRVFAGGKSGKLFVVDAASGALQGFVQLPQGIRVPPVANERGDRLYLVADHSTIVTLSTDDISCVGVYYLGHAAGGVAAPPIAVLNKVIVADNSGAESCRIRVLSLDPKGAIASEVAGSRLQGLVMTPLGEERRRFAAVTTLGQATAFEVGATADDKSLVQLATRDPQDSDQLTRYGLLREGHLWMAGRQLMKLAILPTGNQLSVRSLERDYQGDSFDYPLQAAGDLIVHVRRPAGLAGGMVAATDSKTDKAVWEVALGVPLAGAPAVDSQRGRVTAASASGAVFLLDRQALARRIDDQAFRAATAATVAAPDTAALDLGNGRLAFGAPGAARLWHFLPDSPRDRVKAVELPGALSCPPVRWRDGFVAASDVGQVFLFNADTAEKTASFQPELTPNQKYHWLQPAAGSGADAPLVISDGVEKIYALAFKPQPAPHLEATAGVDVGPSPLTSPLAVIGTRVFAGTKDGGLAMFALPDLKPVEPAKLGGQIVWGPHVTPKGLLMALDNDELALVSPEGAVAWHRPLKHSALGGDPLLAGDAALILHKAGGVSRVNLADGAEASYVELGQPAVAGPVALGERWMLAAPDGTLLVVNPK